MTLVKLTRTWGDGQPVWINPRHVVCVDADGTNTWITTTAPGEKTDKIYVSEAADVVVSRLNLHMGA